MVKTLIIMGTRGIPANHGGFETFAEYLCEYLEPRGWNVIIYCQELGTGRIYQTDWKGVTRIHIPVSQEGPAGTILFDLIATLHSLRHRGVYLTLGYNTAILGIFYRACGKANLINMDGIEWKRQKWSGWAKAWFWLNERLGCWVGNRLIADHPAISEHLATRVASEKITMIPYGAEDVTAGDEKTLDKYGLEPNNYSVVIARPEPENSILEIVMAFSQKKRNHMLVVLGSYAPEANQFHQKVIDAASQEVRFLGPVYDRKIVRSIRFFSRFYLHGHQVGGTNPSLVEAMGAGCAVVANDNKFNRWVAGNGGTYFSDATDLGLFFDNHLEDQKLLDNLKAESKKRFKEVFEWRPILRQYEELLSVFTG